MTKYTKYNLMVISVVSLFLLSGLFYMQYSQGIYETSLKRQQELSSVYRDVRALKKTINKYQKAEAIVGEDYGYVLAKEDVGLTANFSSGEFSKVETLLSNLTTDDRIFDLEKVELNFYEGEGHGSDYFQVYLNGKSIIMARK